MPLPKQVQQDIEEVARIEQEIREHNASVAQQNAAAHTQEPANVEPSPVESTQVASPEPAQEAAARHDDEELTWQQRYKSLNGMYNAEVPQLHASLRESRETISRLEDRMRELESQLAAPKAEPAAQASVTDKDREDFGEELIDLQRRVAAEVLAPVQQELARVQSENAKLREELGKTGNTIATMSFEQMLATKVPDFAQVNADPKWVAWLNEVDPILRAPRRQAAQQAYANGDADGVKHYVDLWKATLTTETAPSVASQELAAQVTPSRTGASAVPGDTTKRTYTADDADREWGRVDQLVRKGDYEAAQQLEAELTAAYQEGRVR